MARSSFSDKAYAGREFAQGLRELRGHDRAPHPSRRARPQAAPGPDSPTHSSRSFWTRKDLLALERHGARTLAGLRERVAQRFLCLAACIWLNHQLGRPSRSLVAYVA